MQCKSFNACVPQGMKNASLKKKKKNCERQPENGKALIHVPLFLLKKFDYEKLKLFYNFHETIFPGHWNPKHGTTE